MKEYLFLLLILGLVAGGFSSCSGEGEDEDNNALLPVVRIESVSGSTACVPGEILEFKARLRDGKADSFSWQVDDGQESGGDLYRFSAAENGVYRLKLAAVNSVGEFSDSVEVTVDDKLFTLARIANWTGEGLNRSALGVQWVTGKNQLEPLDEEVVFKVWGFRWKKGEKRTGLDMLKAIAKNDPRFYLVLKKDYVVGLGYDGDGDGRFQAGNATVSFTQSDFKDGVCSTTADVDDIKVMTTGDYWLGGERKSYATYWLGEGNVVPLEDDFLYSPLFPANRELSDYSWDVWTCSPFDEVNMRNMRPVSRLVKAAEANKQK